MAAILVYLPNCERIVPCLSRAWSSEDAWRQLTVAAWGGKAVAHHWQRAEDLVGILDTAERTSWRLYFLWRRSVQLLHRGQRTFDPRRVVNHATVSTAMRERLVDWMIEVVDSLGGSERIIHMAVDLVDRALAASTALPQTQLQLVGSAALLIAFKV